MTPRSSRASGYRRVDVDGREHQRRVVRVDRARVRGGDARELGAYCAQSAHGGEGDDDGVVRERREQRRGVRGDDLGRVGRRGRGEGRRDPRRVRLHVDRRERPVGEILAPSPRRRAARRRGRARACREREREQRGQERAAHRARPSGRAVRRGRDRSAGRGRARGTGDEGDIDRSRERRRERARKSRSSRTEAPAKTPPAHTAALAHAGRRLSPFRLGSFDNIRSPALFDTATPTRAPLPILPLASPWPSSPRAHRPRLGAARGVGPGRRGVPRERARGLIPSRTPRSRRPPRSRRSSRARVRR